MKFPDFLKDAIKNNSTSLGDHPAFPPEEEATFVSWLIGKRYDEVMSGIAGEDVDDVSKVATRLNKLVTECKKIEEGSKEALEMLCSNICSEIFDIPEDTITINGRLVAECDMSKYRMIPDRTNITFNDIDELRHLTDEVYKRRMIDALIVGAGIYYSENIDNYKREIYDVDPRLPELYAEIFKYNNILLFNKKDTIKNMEMTNTGKVDVTIGDENDKTEIGLNILWAKPTTDWQKTGI